MPSMTLQDPLERDHELKRLAAALASAGDDRGRVLAGGPPGIGKTRLLHAARVVHAPASERTEQRSRGQISPGDVVNVVNVVESPTGLENLREVSGQVSAAGGRVRPRALLRSDAPAESDPTPSLSAWPPATVIDLRSASEYSGAHPLGELGAAIHRIPLSKKLNVLEFDGGDVLREGGLPGLYRYTMAGAESAIVEAVDAVAHGEFPVLIHCTLGKDRTGIVVATILAAIGVTEAAIVADYVETTANVDRIIARLASINPPAMERIQDLLVTYPEGLGATAEAVDAVLQVFKEAGGVEAWLHAHGMTDEALAALRSRLLET